MCRPAVALQFDAHPCAVCAGRSSASANYVVARIAVGLIRAGWLFHATGEGCWWPTGLKTRISVDPTRAPIAWRRQLVAGPSWCRVAPRRTDFLFRTLFVPGADRLRELPHRLHLRRALSGISHRGRFLRDIVDNKLLEDVKKIHRALQVECGDPKHPDRVRTEHGEVLLARGAVRQPHACRSDDLHPQFADQAQPLEAAWLRDDAGKAVPLQQCSLLLLCAPRRFAISTHAPAHRHRRKSLRGASACHHRWHPPPSTPSSRRSPAATSTPSAPVFSPTRSRDRREESRNHALAGPEPCIGPSARWPSVPNSRTPVHAVNVNYGNRELRTVNCSLVPSVPCPRPLSLSACTKAPSTRPEPAQAHQATERPARSRLALLRVRPPRRRI